MIEQGFEILENLDSIPYKYLFYLAESYNLAGVSNNNIGDYQEAIKYYQKSLQSYKKRASLDSIEYVAAYYNIGFSWSHKNNLDSARVYFEKAESILFKLPKNHPEYTLFQLILNRDKSMAFQNQPDSMLIFAEKAVRLLTNRTPKRDSASTYSILGLALTKVNRLKEAEENLLTALRISNSLELTGNTYPKHYALKLLGDLYVAKGSFEKAQLYYDLAIKLYTPNSDLETISSFEVVDKFRVLKAIHGKMKCFVLQQDADISSTIHYSHLTRNLIFDLRKSFQAEGSKLDLARFSHEIGENSLLLMNRFINSAYRDTLLASTFSFIES